jgi:sigma-B regulation protein RsbU (phosphoserine phosphatase)
MLPKDSIVTSRVHTAFQYVPCDELAGDAVGLYIIDERYLVAYVLDVSGHGVPAALLSVSAMRALEPEPPESSLLRDLITGDSHLGTVQRPARVAAELSRRFRAGENDGRYLTMSLAVLDTHDGRLQLTSAGHPPPLLVRDGQSIGIPDAGGFPIGMIDGGTYDDATIQMRRGDRLCLYSDGVIEQFAPGGVSDQYGDERLLGQLVHHAAIEPDRVVNDIVADLSRWSGGGAFDDDVSLVLVEWRGPP